MSHWKKIWSTTPERLNKEVKRRTDVVGVFPNPAALLRLARRVLVEAHDEWQVTAERRYLSEHSMAPTRREVDRRWQARTYDGMIRSLTRITGRNPPWRPRPEGLGRERRQPGRRGAVDAEAGVF